MESWNKSRRFLCANLIRRNQRVAIFGSARRVLHELIPSPRYRVELCPAFARGCFRRPIARKGRTGAIGWHSPRKLLR
jgi:hypothetical protein